MEKNHDPYHISLFKPTTPQARYNRNMVLSLVSIWAVAVFGFHIVLRIIEKPVPEEPLIEFRGVTGSIADGTANADHYAAMAKAGLSVYGKNNLSPEEENILKTGITWSFLKMVPDGEKSILSSRIDEFLQTAAGITDIGDPDYVRQKKELGELTANYLSFDPGDVRQRLLPLAFSSPVSPGPVFEGMEEYAATLEKFMVHNRSVLTDLKFLGFPFHYFYSAVFLLILFVGLCWVYCVRTDAMHKKLQIAE